MPAFIETQIVSGDAFEQTIELRDGDGEAVDLTGFTAEFVARSSPSESRSYSFPVAVADATGGVLSVSATSAQASIPPGSYAFMLAVVSPEGERTSVLRGRMHVLGTPIRP